MSKMITCSLCGMSFDENDDLIDARKNAHEKFHAPSKIKRNMTMGVVEWRFS